MSYYVVTLERGDPLLDMFHYLGGKLVEESMARVRDELLRTGDSSFLQKLERVEIYTFGEVMPGYEHTVPEWMKIYMPTPEYERFGRVYFLNDLAFSMYTEGGIDFEVAKIISDGELPEGCSRSLGAPYMPKLK